MATRHLAPWTSPPGTSPPRAHCCALRAAVHSMGLTPRRAGPGPHRCPEEAQLPPRPGTCQPGPLASRVRVQPQKAPKGKPRSEPRPARPPALPAGARASPSSATGPAAPPRACPARPPGPPLVALGPAAPGGGAALTHFAEEEEEAQRGSVAPKVTHRRGRAGAAAGGPTTRRARPPPSAREGSPPGCSASSRPDRQTPALAAAATLTLGLTPGSSRRAHLGRRGADRAPLQGPPHAQGASPGEARKDPKVPGARGRGTPRRTISSRSLPGERRARPPADATNEGGGRILPRTMQAGRAAGGRAQLTSAMLAAHPDPSQQRPAPGRLPRRARLPAARAPSPPPPAGPGRGGGRAGGRREGRGAALRGCGARTKAPARGLPRPPAAATAGPAGPPPRGPARLLPAAGLHSPEGGGRAGPGAPATRAPSPPPTRRRGQPPPPRRADTRRTRWAAAAARERAPQRPPGSPLAAAAAAARPRAAARSR